MNKNMHSSFFYSYKFWNMGIQGNENSFLTRDFRIGPDDSISYYLRRLSNNSVIITNKQKEQCSAKIPTNSTGPAMQLKRNTELVSPLEEIIPVSARIIGANVLLYGCYLRVICCYGLTEEDSDSSKNIFYYK